ncbi:MAG: mitochondrial fission ELM1 family protein [Proteobacteria bacterium]|nr:mitochondrial fission ELM1 family protein [Pseudomonadota bacterium]
MSLTLWRFTDNKPGHDSQSIGLCSAIGAIKTCDQYDLPAGSPDNRFFNLVTRQFPAGASLPDPDILIGAGHGTHLPMLAAKRARGGKIIVLMKPSLPVFLFDMCIIPEHDAPPDKKNIIVTTGAINKIKTDTAKDVASGLILLGGPSKHFAWDEPNILNQIKSIISNDLDTNWLVADSPRTPDTTLATLKKWQLNATTLLSYSDSKPEELQNHIQSAGKIWVSADSISMIYESLTAGAPVGIIEVLNKTESRIVNAINNLINENEITTFKQWQQNGVMKPNSLNLNEALRCSRLLQEKSFFD